MKTKNEILGLLYYKTGRQLTNFRIFHNYYIDNEKKFSKWVNYLDATEKDINKATHRTVLNNEIVLDFDPEKGQTLKDVTKKVKKVCFDLKKKGVIYECFFTGSRGYHIHIFINDLLYMPKKERETYRKNIIRFFGAEIQKGNDNSPIALEGVPHWKSGKSKKRCEW